MSRFRRRRLYVAPPPPASVSRPDLAPLADELLTRRTHEATEPSPLGAYGLRRCVDELLTHALPDARVDIQPAGWSGCGIAILPSTDR